MSRRAQKQQATPTKPPKRYSFLSHGSPTKTGILQIESDSERDDPEFEVDERRHSTVDEALAILHAQEQMPTGTPGGSREDLRRGALIDGARVQPGG